MRTHWTVAVVVGLGACGGGGDPLLVPGPAEVELASTALTVAQPCGGDVDDGLDGTLDARWTFVYTDGGGHERDTKVSLDNQILEDWSIDYDHAGRLLGWTGTFADSPPSTYRYVYDTFGRRLSSSSDNDGDGVFEFVETVTAWNEAGRSTESTTVIGDLVYRSTTTYDSHGRIQEIRSIKTDGSPYRVISYTYDDVARTRTRNSDGIAYHQVQVNTYDAQGHVIRLFFGYDQPGNDTTLEYTYDGDRLVTAMYTFTDSVERTTYDYCN